MVIDIHAHAFPDALAARAIPALEAEGNCKAALDGTIASLLRSMDEAGIDRSVVLSIATKPDQASAILRWSEAIRSDRLEPFPSVHPADPHAAARVGEIARAGFRGIKLHPYYQGFDLDEERLAPIYGAMEEAGLILLCHTGFDMAFPRDRKADPARITRVVERFPGLSFVVTHLGAWEDWDEVEARLLGRPVYMETSYSLPYMPPARAVSMMTRHGMDRVLFGSDSPWAGQREALAELRALGLDAESLAKVEGGNARRLLGE